MTKDRDEEVELIEAERVVAHGAALTTWLVRHGQAWTRATEWPGAVVERRDAGPGTVWERAVTLVVPRGTELLRVETRPRHEVPRDPLSYLERAIRSLPRSTHRTRYRVEVGGRVLPVARPQ